MDIRNEFTNFFLNRGVDSHTIESLLDICFFKSYNCGEIILSMGECSDSICLIMKGIVRGYYIDIDGNNITKCFSLEGDLCCSYGYLSDLPSPFYVEAIEDSILACLKIKQLKTLIEAEQTLRKFRDDMMRDVFMNSEERVRSFSGMEAKERYLRFVEEHPDICNRVKQEYIASFLGITPSSLSRIKRNL